MRLTGQIGCGKTTFIHRQLAEAARNGVTPDLKLALDTEPADFSPSTISAYLLAKLIRGFPSALEPMLKELPVPASGMEETAVLLAGAPRSPEQRQRRDQMLGNLASDQPAVWSVLERALVDMQDRLGRRLFVLIEGLDKLPEERADYLACEPLLEFFATEKTLYETNLIHALRRGPSWKEASDQLFLPPFSDERVRDLLIDRRMIWWVPEQELLSLLERWPNLRQFFRVLRLEQEIREDLDPAVISEDIEDLRNLETDSAEAGALIERLEHVLTLSLMIAF